MTRFAAGIETPWGMAAGGDGGLFFIGLLSGGIYRVAPDGETSLLSQGSDGTFDLVVDGDGQLLATEIITGEVLRIDPTSGEVSRFADGLSIPTGLTVGPDGDVWVAEAGAIVRFGPDGRRIDRIVRGASSPEFLVSMVFSPDGALHYATDGSNVYRLDGTEERAVLTQLETAEGLAFDEDGFLYVADAGRGQIDVYDPNYELQVSGVARSNVSLPTDLVFLRDEQGGMTSRLLASSWANEGIFELNPAGVRAPGFRVGVDFLDMPESVPDAIVGADYAHTLAVKDVSGAVWRIVDGGLPPGTIVGPGDWPYQWSP